ncbi:MAG: cyclic 2,3-diphosphoglycerate synthase [Actinomycetota bacterium]|nr:cyclic 2,3-diphosphoglycerate synthase [Actinomycetota bacterium]MDH5223847.1 cyclic 2,3-diphosphoglycerate synthase [Actinomycetota bacterium]
MSKRRVLIMGAAGRDFHNFNTVYRGDADTSVVAFTATQIPFIDDRRYPPELAGPGYPDGIQIYDESELGRLIGELEVDDVVFSYSDVSHEDVMHTASEVIAAGANFVLLGPRDTLIKATVPTVAVTAVRTGVGKSQTTRAIAGVLKDAGKRVVAVRHPMPYGDLVAQRVQRYAELADLDRFECTIEEREEYEPHITSGTVIYAGVDYGAILEQAQAEADVLLWDGGNNDLPFYTPDVWITLVDPLRAGHELTYHPGEANLRAADVILINKMDSATVAQVAQLDRTIGEVNPTATVIKANSRVSVDDPDAIRGKRVLVVEDGPTLTHGSMKIGAGVVAAQRGGAAEIVDPRPWAIGTIAETFEKYDVGAVLPAMGYSDGQLQEMAAIIDAADVDLVVIGTPIDLRRVIDIAKPAVRVRYDLDVLPESPQLTDVLKPVLG